MFFQSYLHNIHALMREEGVIGVNRYLSDLRSRNLFFKFISVLDNKLFGIQNALELAEETEISIPKVGTNKTFIDLMEKLNIAVSLQTDLPQWTSKEGQAVLFYSTHQALIEPAYILALLKREDTIFLATPFLQSLGENIGKHILPVLAKKFAVERQKVKLPFNVKRLFDKGLGLTEKQITTMNIKTMKQAGSELIKGKAIGLFPTGGSSDKTQWFFGIGTLISQIHSQDRKHILLGPMYYEGLDEKEASRQAKTALKKQPTRKATVKAWFGKSLDMYTLLKDEQDPEKITTILKQNYFDQFPVH